MWFGKPVGTKESKIAIDQSPMGRFTQKISKDKDGQPIKWYRKPVYNPEDNSEIIGFDEVTENTGDPVIVWEGTPQEGLMYSVLYTLQDIFRGDFKNAFSNEDRLSKVYFALADTLLMMLVFGMIKALFDAFIEENGPEGISGNTAQFMSSVSKKVLSEANMYENTLGALKTEPAFVSYSTRVATDVLDVFNGDRTVNNMLARNVRMFEFLD